MLGERREHTSSVVTGLSLQTKIILGGGAASATGRSPTISSTSARFWASYFLASDSTTAASLVSSVGTQSSSNRLAYITAKLTISAFQALLLSAITLKASPGPPWPHKTEHYASAAARNLKGSSKKSPLLFTLQEMRFRDFSRVLLIWHASSRDSTQQAFDMGKQDLTLLASKDLSDIFFTIALMNR